MASRRVDAALAAVLGHGVPLLPAPEQAGASSFTIGDRLVGVVWLPVGWPRNVREVAARSPKPDLVAAPVMSPGARRAASDAGLGWLDETGAADFALSPTFRIRLDGTPPERPGADLGWRPATTAVCEALLTGSGATVAAVQARTRLAMSTVARELKVLQGEGLLRADAGRGRNAARVVTDPSALLEAFATRAPALRAALSLRVGVLWRDPVDDLVALGRAWEASGRTWSATGALAAEVLAPLLTEVSPMEVYVDARSLPDLRLAAGQADLRASAGGRLVLRPFPTPAGGALSTEPRPGFRSVSWPRAFADLRGTGVRGEDAADHLREVCEGVRA